MSNINDEYINDFKLDYINICKNCDKKLTLSFVSYEIICDKCGYTEKICANLDGNYIKILLEKVLTLFIKELIILMNIYLHFKQKKLLMISPHVYDSIIKFLKKDKKF